MKKALLSLAAAFAAVAFNASADYYLVGGFNGWDNGDANYKFTDAGDGTFTLDMTTNLTSGFKVTDGTWDDANTFGAADENTKLVLGQPYALAHPGGNIPLSVEAVENAHIVFNPTAMTLVITGGQADVTISYAIHGDIFGDPSWSSVDMTEQNGKWVLSNTTVAAGNFGIKKLADGNQVEWLSATNASEATIVLDKAISVKNEGTNFRIGAGTYTFTLDPEAMTLTVTGEGETPTPPTTDFSAWWVKLPGTYNSWDTYNGGVQQTENGIFKFTNVVLMPNSSAEEAGQFKICAWNGTADVWYGVAGPVTLGTPASFSEGGGNISITTITEGAAYNVTVNFNDYTILVEGEGDNPNPPTPGGDYPDLYLVGSSYGNWTPSTDLPKFDRKENVYTLKLENGVDAGDYGWKVCNGTWNFSFGCGEVNTPLVDGDPVEAFFGGENNNFMTTYSGPVYIIFTLVEGSAQENSPTPSYIQLATTVGVEGIAADKAAAEYYTLQGVRVANPTAGQIYIVRQGAKATKVMF